MRRQIVLAFAVAVVVGGIGPPAAADGADDDSGLKSESLTLLELSGLPQGEKAAVRKVVAKGMSEIRLCFRAYYGERLVERRVWVVLNVDAHGRIASVSYANPTSTARVANPKELAQCVRASLEKDAGARLPSKRRIVLPFRYFPRVQPQELFGTTRADVTGPRSAEDVTAAIRKLEPPLLACLRTHVRRDFVPGKVALVFLLDPNGTLSKMNVLVHRLHVIDRRGLEGCFESRLRRVVWGKASAGSRVAVGLLYVSGMRRKRK